MALSFSHIAWPPEDEAKAIDALRSIGVDALEVAPHRVFGDPLTARESSVRDKAGWYREKGFRISSFQALLFGTEGLELFGEANTRHKLKEMLISIGRLAGWAGARPMVFGSPRNRLRKELGYKAAIQLAADFFREVGDACAEAGSCLVMEANPEEYGADFCTRLEEAAELVERVESPGFGLHVDTGGMALAQEDFETILKQALPLVQHVHVSQPYLGPLDVPDPIHHRLAKILQEGGYRHDVAIEMRAQPDALNSVREAVAVTRRLYSPLV